MLKSAIATSLPQISGGQLMKYGSTMQITNEVLIHTIRVLPDILIEQSGILLDWEGNDKALDVIRLNHRAHAEWLRYLLLDDVTVLPDLLLTDKALYKPIAERTISRLQLAKELWLHSTAAQQYFSSPLEWVLMLEACGYKDALLISYISHDAKLTGKSKRYTIFKKYYDALSETCGNGNKLTFRDDLTPLQFLEVEAATIASKDIKFRNGYFRRYCQEQKRFHAQMRDSNLNLLLVNADGSVNRLVGGRKK
jgi:hypothetical protein